MQRPIASVPKPSPIGSTHGLAEIGALSSANTTTQASPNFFTRPTASVPQPTPITPANINPPVHVAGNRPVASVPLGGQSQLVRGPIGTTLGSGRLHGGPAKPVNYPSRGEE